MNLNRCLLWGRCLCILLCLSACSLNHGYSPDAHRQLLRLETLQMAFIYDGSETPLNPQRLQDDHQRILAQFRQALSLSRALGDTPRTDTLLTLQTAYLRLHTRFSQQERAFTPAQAAVFKQQLRLVYQLAVEGECSRSSADCAAGVL